MTRQRFEIAISGLSLPRRTLDKTSSCLSSTYGRLVPAGVRFRPSPATCDASMPRFGDCLSTGVRALRLFLLAAADGAFPVPQDALLWTYREVSSVRSWAVL